MPYIEKKYRFPLIDTANKDVLEVIEVIDATEYAEILENILVENCVPEGKWDGVINYALSKLLLSNQKSLFEYKLGMVFHRVYVQIFEEHGYQGRERFIGLLHCMYSEFCRRSWGKYKFLHDQCGLYLKVLAEYENGKLKENGDIV